MLNREVEKIKMYYTLNEVISTPVYSYQPHQSIHFKCVFLIYKL